MVQSACKEGLQWTGHTVAKELGLELSESPSPRPRRDRALSDDRPLPRSIQCYCLGRMFVCPECGSSLSHPGFCPDDGTALVSRGDDAILGTNAGAYRIAKLLGVGGMGRVYLAIHPQIGSRVAVKVLSRECSDRPELVERFFSEARAVNLIRHENIVNVLDLSTLPDGRPYIVMEFLDGAPLSSVIATQGPLPLGGLARLIGEVLDALSKAHEKGIVHRDLKPDNIFVTPAGRGKVLDFGIAKLQPEMGSGAQTRTGSLLGTPHYMSPEQAQGRVVDARTDLYAVGIIMFECATGRRPFNAEGLYDLLRKHVDEAPPRPIALRPDLPPSYEAVILRLLAKDPHQRFQSANEVAGALSQAAGDLPAHAWTTIAPGTGPRALAIGPGSSPSGAPAVSANWHQQTGGSSQHPNSHAPAYGVPHGTPPPMYAPAPTTLSATAGKTEAASTKGGNGLKIGLAVAALAAIGGGVFALTSGGDDAKPASAIAPTIGDAVDKLNGALGELGGLPLDNPTTNDTPAANTPPETNDDGDGDGDGDGNGDVTDEDLAKMIRANAGDLSGLNPAQRKLVEQQLDLAAEQMKLLDPASRKMVAQQMKLSEAQMEKSGLIRQPDGSRKYIAPGTERPSGFSETSFDVSSFLPSATAAANKMFSDAELVRIDATGVAPNGTINFQLSDEFYAIYTYESPSRGKRPADLPKGVPHKATCKIQVWVTPDGVRSQELPNWECEGRPIKAPRCTASALWKKAISSGATSNAVGTIAIWHDGKAPRWIFSIEDDYSGILPDDC